MKHTLKLGLAIAAVVALTATGAGCGNEEEEEDAPMGTFTGRVADSDAYIALISDGERVTGYVCDGERISTWLAPAALDGDAATLETRDGEPTGSVTLSADQASGESTSQASRTSSTLRSPPATPVCTAPRWGEARARPWPAGSSSPTGASAAPWPGRFHSSSRRT